LQVADDIKASAITTEAVSAIGRRGAFSVAAKLGLGTAALASGIGAAFPALAQSSAGLPKKPYKFVFVCHVTLDQFFTPAVYGIQDACAAFGCHYQWIGSQKNVVSEMVNAMETAIAEKADGIAVCLVDPTAFDASTAKAAAAGIPVIAFNADVPVGSPNKRLAYIGQPLYQAGYNIALKWLKMVPKGSHVMLSIGMPGSLNEQPRLDGYIQAIKDHGDGITYDVVNTGVDAATEISRIGSYVLSHKNVAGIFTTGGSDTYAAGFVSQQYGLAKKGVIVAGFDLFPQTLGYIKSGDMTFTTDQQAYLQGFLPVQQMYMYKLSNGLVGPADTNTSEAYVTKDNVDHYLTKSRFEGSVRAEPV
jgi:simple sugar transport system substrate-binding protein